MCLQKNNPMTVKRRQHAGPHTRIAKPIPGLLIDHVIFEKNASNTAGRDRQFLLWLGVGGSAALIFGLWMINLFALFSDNARAAKETATPLEEARDDLLELFKTIESPKTLTEKQTAETAALKEAMRGLLLPVLQATQSDTDL